MNINDVIKNSVLNQFTPQINLTAFGILTMFLLTSVFSVYVFLIYRITSKRSFYNPNFAKTLVGLPIITATIIIAMQVNILVSLGMVGALSIVRFRNAVKDPLDLLFLFWSITLGIVCGTGAYTLSIMCCLILTVIIFVIDFVPMKSATYLLSVKGTRNMNEKDILKALASHSKGPKIRTRNCQSDSLNLLIELVSKNDAEIIDTVMSLDGVSTASLITHDGELRC